MLYELAQRRYLEICKFLQQLEKRVEKYPDGKIHVVHSGKVTQYYLRTNSKDKSGKYISKREKEKIQKYVQKKYDQEVLAHLKLEKSSLEQFINNAKNNSVEVRNLYSSNPSEVKSLITPIDISDEDYKEMWINAKFIGKDINPNSTYFTTNRGEQVRSKSELTIANALDKHGVPYKYECPLLLSNGVTIHPDFTILNVKTRQEFYWEHRGMMDDRDYARHSVKRIKELAKEGILLGDNLIITEETSDSPLGTAEINLIIKKFLG